MASRTRSLLQSHMRNTFLMADFIHPSTNVASTQKFSSTASLLLHHNNTAHGTNSHDPSSSPSPPWPQKELYAKYIPEHSPFTHIIGMKLKDFGHGWCETVVQPVPQHLLQHHGFVHAGCQATLGDHTCGIAASTMLPHPESQVVLSATFKIDLLRPALIKDVERDSLVCRAKVIKSGKTLIVTESELFVCSAHDASETLVSKLSMLASVVEKNKTKPLSKL